MKEGQTQIFYATGETRQQILKSPHLEAFKAKGYEVLLLTDPVDEVWVGIGDRVRRQTAAVGGQGRGGPRLRGGEDGARGRAQGAGEGLRRPADLVEGDLERSRQGSAAVHAPDRVAGLPDHRRLRDHTDARAHVPGLRAGRFRSGSGFSNSTRTIRSSPACAKRTRTAATIPRSPRPPNCSTAQHFSLKGAHSRIRRGSPSCSPTA